MNQLLPIIRRVRRPLLVADVPPAVVGNVEPVQANAEMLKVQSEPQEGTEGTSGNGEQGCSANPQAGKPALPDE
jgi:hypothetical protein